MRAFFPENAFAWRRFFVCRHVCHRAGLLELTFSGRLSWAMREGRYAAQNVQLYLGAMLLRLVAALAIA